MSKSLDKVKNKQYIEKNIAKARLSIASGLQNNAIDKNPICELYKDYIHYSIDEEPMKVYTFEYTADYNYIDRQKEEVKNSSNIHSKYAGVILQRHFDLQQPRINSLDVNSPERKKREKACTLCYHLEPVKKILDSNWKTLALCVNESATIYSTLILRSSRTNKCSLLSDYKKFAIYIASTKQGDRFFVGLQECSREHFLGFLSSNESLAPILEKFSPIIEKLYLDKEVKESTKTVEKTNKI